MSRHMQAERVARRFLAIVFPTDKAFQRYMEEHPNADPKRHSVKERKTKERIDTKRMESLFSEKERGLPAVTHQPVKDPDELFDQAREAHEEQLDWLDRGEGIDKAIGARTVRADKGESLDLSEPGPVVLIGPMKKRSRSEEKVSAEYDGDWSRLTDVVRASVAVDSFDQIEDVLEKLRKSGIKLAKRPNNRFARPTDAGYRDISLSVVYPNGHVGELQIHLKSILQAKEKGHKYYEETRSISAKAKEEGRDTLTEDEAKIVEKANKKMKELYGEAWEGALSGEKKSASLSRFGATKYYVFEDNPSYWKMREFPHRITGKGKSTIYDIETFFREARPVSKQEYDRIKKELVKKAFMKMSARSRYPFYFSRRGHEAALVTKKDVIPVTPHDRTLIDRIMSRPDFIGWVTKAPKTQWGGEAHVVVGDMERSIWSTGNKPTPEQAAKDLRKKVRETVEELEELQRDTVKRLELALKGHDWYHMMSDDPRYWRAGERSMNLIKRLLKEVDPEVGRRLWKKYAPKDFGTDPYR